MWKRRSQAVVVMSEEHFVANAAALTLLGGSADLGLLRNWARDASSRGRERTARLELGPDLEVTARCRPVSVASRHPAVVVTLAPAATTSAPGRAPRSSSWSDRLLGQLARARAARVPVLLRGERGTGKTTLARCCHARTADPRPLTVVDCALSGLRGPNKVRGAAVCACR